MNRLLLDSQVQPLAGVSNLHSKEGDELIIAKLEYGCKRKQAAVLPGGKSSIQLPSTTSRATMILQRIEPLRFGPFALRTFLHVQEQVTVLTGPNASPSRASYA